MGSYTPTLSAPATRRLNPFGSGWPTAKRGDRLHEQEAARFELDIENNPKKALALAANNYKLQKEARDAEVLLRTALANKDAAVAEPALAWFKQNKYEDAHLADLAASLAKLGGSK